MALQTTRSKRTEKLLRAAALLNDLDNTGLELLNRGHVVGKNAHLARLGWDVDLNDVLGLVDGLKGGGGRRISLFHRLKRPTLAIGIPDSALAIERGKPRLKKGRLRT